MIEFYTTMRVTGRCPAFGATRVGFERTLVIMMGVATLPAITAELIKHGLAAASLAMTVADAAMTSQQSVRGTLADIAAVTKEADIKPPTVTVIGAVAGFSPTQPTRESIEPRTS